MVIFGFIASLVVFIACFIGAIKDDDFKGEDVALGVVLVLTFFSSVLFGFDIFCGDKLYHEKYSNEISDVKEYRIDTTFVTTNNVTDTTYTIYYNNSKDSVCTIFNLIAR